MSTFASFITRCRRELEEASASTWSDDSLLAWGNDSIRDYARRVRPLAEDNATLTSTVGVASYALPGLTVEVFGAYYDDHELGKVSLAEMGNLIVTATAHGTPAYYTILDGNVYLSPPPDASGKAITLTRSYRPPAMPTVTATTAMPWGGIADHVLSEYVMAKAYAQIQDFESASFHKSLYENDVAGAIHERLSGEAAGGFVGCVNVY